MDINTLIENFDRFSSKGVKNSEIKNVSEMALSGAEVARELGVSRAHIKQMTSRIIPKIYNNVSNLLGPDENSPVQIVMNIIQVLNVSDDPAGMRDIVNNLSKEQKKLLADDIRSNYPQFEEFFSKSKLFKNQ